MGRFAVGVLSLLLVIAGAAVPAAAGQSDAFADVLVDDLVIGEPVQEFPGMRAVAFDSDAETVRLELDLSVLTAHGVDVGAADIELPGGAVYGATVESATVSDGRATFVFAPDDSTDDAVIEVESFRINGLDTSGAERATDVTYEATFSAGEARVRSFDIVDPDRVTPWSATTTFFAGASTHRVSLQDVQAAGEDVTIELDVRVLAVHGVDLEALDADVTADGGTVVETTLDRGVVTAVVSPAPGVVLFDVRVALEGVDVSFDDADQRVVASNVTYGVTVEGAAGDDVTVEPFDIVTHPTTHADPVTTRSMTSNESLVIKGDGFGPALTVAALALLGWLARRRQ